jgi:hypothetical protein
MNPTTPNPMLRSFRFGLSAIILAAVTVSVSAGQVLPDQAAYNATYEARVDSLLSALSGSIGLKAERWWGLHQQDPMRPVNQRILAGDTLAPPTHIPAQRMSLLEAAFLIKSGVAPQVGNEAVRQSADFPLGGGMFFIHDVMAAYLYAGDLLEPETREAVRRSLGRNYIYRGDTENHWLKYYTGLYLAAQTWPNEPREAWFNGRSSDENLAEARGFYEDWIRTTTTIGQGEFDSPTYIITFLMPLFLMYQFAEDPEMKENARKMLDWVIADYAVDYLKGLYTGGHSRDYSFDAILPERAPSVGWGWLLFGETEPLYRSDNVLAAWSDYRLPVVIHNVAVDRSEPYEHFERKRVRNVIRYGDEKNPPVYKTLFMTADYALGSLQGGILQPIQQHTWDISYADSRPNSTVFTLHPYYSGRELAMFFPEEVEWLSDEVDRFHLVYTDPNKWNSSSPYERTFQHRNAIIVLYDIEEGARHPHVNGFFPKALDERVVDASGWIFFRGGQMFGAMYPLQPYEWIEEPVNYRLRSHELRNGFVVEVARASEYASFDAFKSRIRANELDTSRFPSEVRVSYVTSEGNEMTFSFPERRVLNGQEVDLSWMPLFYGPFLNGEGYNRTLVITHGEMRHEVSFAGR